MMKANKEKVTVKEKKENSRHCAGVVEVDEHWNNLCHEYEDNLDKKLLIKLLIYHKF